MFLPQSDWVAPAITDLPRWAGAKRIGIDIETCDPTLKELGPGVRRSGFIVGVSFAIEDGPKFYLPIRHGGGGNMPMSEVLQYLRHEALQFRGTLVGANIPYDLDYLASSGIEFPNVEWIRDIQIADPLIYELHMRYSLDEISKRRGFVGKNEGLLRAAALAYGVDPKKGLHKLPAKFVGAYGEDDADLPLKVLRIQEREIESLDLWKVYNLESKLTPVILKMIRRGVRIDEDALDKVSDRTIIEEQKYLDEIHRLTNIRIGLDQINKKGPLDMALKRVGVIMKTTPTGQPQIDKAFLKSLNNPVADAILGARQVNKLRSTFVKSIRAHMVKGRIHCTYNQVRSTRETGDEEGARFGRLSCSHPNLQQQPSRGEFAKVWRSIYLPEEGRYWCSADYSQQEPRFITHYAEICGLSGASAAGDRYRADPNTDNHQMFADLCGIPRRPAKDIYLGLCYGMGSAKLARSLGLPTKMITGRNGPLEVAGEEAQAILDTFDARVPFVSQLRKRVEKKVMSHGEIRTIGGRVCHFPKKGDDSYDWAHKGLNRVVQGSAADQIKEAMVELDAAGIQLQLQVHDEVGLSIETVEDARRVGEIMTHCVELTVPNKVDVEIGPSWGEAVAI